MKLCIYGAGAVGSVLAAALSNVPSVELSLIGRGAHLDAIKKNGLFIESKGTTKQYNVFATSEPETLPQQDYILLTTKSYHLPDIAPNVATLMHEHTRIVPLCNGVPWWYLKNLSCDIENLRLKSLDPEGRIEHFIPIEHVLGGIVYMTGERMAPGIVKSLTKPIFAIGTPNGQFNRYLQHLSDVFSNAGFEHPVQEDIRSIIWKKLCWNTAFNPLSVIFKRTSYELTTQEDSIQMAKAIMNEMVELAHALNVRLHLDINHHIEMAKKAGHHKPSMLQDFEQGRPLETAAILDAVEEIASLLSKNIPTIQEVAKKVRALDAGRRASG